MTRILTVTSARGGAGTTSIALNLALLLARLGQRVCLLDADAQRPAIAERLGLGPRHNLGELLLEGLAPERLLIRDCWGIDVIAGAGAQDWGQETQPAQRERMADLLRALDGYDWLLIDSCAGRDPLGSWLARASPAVCVTLTPDAQRLSETYALLKLLALRGHSGRVSLLVNRVTERDAAEQAWGRLQAAARDHLGIPAPVLGMVHEDARVGRVLAQPPLPGAAPESPGGHDLAVVARALLEDAAPREAGVVAAFAERWLALAEGEDALLELSLGAARESRTKRREQLESELAALSTQIERLLVEMNRLRAEGEDIARLVASPQSRPRAGSAADVEAWVASRARASRQLRVDGISFPVYELQRCDTSALQVACHGREEDEETAAPRSTQS